MFNDEGAKGECMEQHDEIRRAPQPKVTAGRIRRICERFHLPFIENVVFYFRGWPSRRWRCVGMSSSRPAKFFVNQFQFPGIVGNGFDLGFCGAKFFEERGILDQSAQGLREAFGVSQLEMQTIDSVLN